MISTIITKSHEGVAYEWDAIDTAHNAYKRVGTVLRDNEGTWYAQDLKANFQRFETGTEAEREQAAKDWLDARS
jgi:hypothetical protein